MRLSSRSSRYMGQLGSPDAVDLGELLPRARLAARHVDQGAVREDDIGRDPALPRQLQTQRLEPGLLTRRF